MTMLLDIGAGRVATVATFYKVSQLLGVGRFSEVYKAFDTHSDTDVALKIYSGFDEEAHEIAKTEESALARISELNSEYFPKLRRSIRHRIQNRNHPVIVMELGGYIGLDGHKRVLSLNDVVLRPGIASGSLEPDLEFWSIESLIVWIIHLVQAVKQLHDLGILHRDLKPANILLKRGTGQSSAVPMLLDFNSAAPLRASGSTRGTPRYLPPEVISGTRSEPAPADDIWAVALIAWEILHGQGTSPDSPCIASGSIVGSIPDSVIETLRRALSLDPGARFATAVDLLDALESAVRPAETLNVLASDEVARARSAMDRIKNVMLQAVAPPGELLVPKEIEDTVTTVIAWLAEENSQSLDLVSELVRIGPLAIPVCLEQGYRLHRNKLTYSEVLRAIAQLASQHKSVAHTSIDKHALSSNQGVRSLCFALCEEIGYFPEVMLDSLKGDEGVLLPAERLLIADLCVRFSRRRTAVFGLEKYMCREYILNRHRFRILRDTVARKMHLLQSGEQKFITPLLIYAKTHAGVFGGN